MCKENNQDLAIAQTEKLLRCMDVAHILNISRSKAYLLVQSGEIASVRFGGSVRIRPSDLRAFISSRVSGGASLVQ